MRRSDPVLTSPPGPPDCGGRPNFMTRPRHSLRVHLAQINPRLGDLEHNRDLHLEVVAHTSGYTSVG